MSPRRAPKTLRELVGAYWGEQCLVVLDAQTPLRGGENVIHPTRVAIRRARSTFRVFGELFERSEREQLDEELRWWASVLGAVRDLDVLERRLEDHLATLPPELVLGPVRARLAEVVAGRRQHARSELVGALDSDRYAALDGLVRDWHRDPRFTAAADRPAEQVRRFVDQVGQKADRRLAHAGRAAHRHDPDADERLHRARKAAKRHRYAVEAAQPLWGAKADKIVKRRKKLQTTLGEYQDSVVAAAFLRELGALTGRDADGTGFTWGLLYAQQQERGTRVVAKLKLPR